MIKNKFLYDFYRMTGEKHTKVCFRMKLKMMFMQNLRFVNNIRKLEQGSKFARIKLYLLSRKYGLEVSNSSKIGRGLRIIHPYNITIGSGVILGEDCDIYKGATLGNIPCGSRKGAPKLGSSVIVGINSTIVGGINIGDDVFIAPNSFVNFSVPSHSVVIGSPGKIINKVGATKNYIHYKSRDLDIE